jgi:chemotaxis protein methyltransferase CheR
MATTITTHEFERVREFLQRETSISLTDDKAYLVETRLSAIMKAHGYADYDALLAAMTANRPQGLRDLVIDAMTTNETLWFRDSAPFEAFRDHLLPAYAGEIQAGSRSRIRIWSAACSTGQEPYSLAMVYDEATRRFPALRPSHLEILATDLSESALATATAGVYGGMAIQRGLPVEQLERYFSAGSEGRFTVRPEIRERVVFRKFNLRDTFIMLGSFDIILTRYVLIYFQDEFKREVLRKAQCSLDKGGVLFLGASESLPAGVPGFAMVRRGRATWYQKSDAGVSRVAVGADTPTKVAPASANVTAGVPAAPATSAEHIALRQRLKDLNAKYSK